MGTTRSAWPITLYPSMINDGYNAIGLAAEQADAACPPGDYTERWLAICRAVRNWALAHPHEYALIYGSPVPGYQAPQATIAPAGRVALVMGTILADARSPDARSPDARPPKDQPGARQRAARRPGS